MDTTGYHVFGIGLGTEDLRYIGWTQRSVDDEREQIFSELLAGSSRDLARWVGEAIELGRLSIFEIESARSAEAARDSATGLCVYFRSLGLDVRTAAP